MNEVDDKGNTLPDLLLHQVKERSKTLALFDHKKSLSFEEIDRISNKIASGLTELNIGRGDRVACLTRYHLDCLLLTLAACKVGVVCVPVNWRLSPSEVEYALQDSNSKFILCDHEFLRKLNRNLMVSPRDRVNVVCTDKSTEKYESFKKWYLGYSDESLIVPIEADDPALQLYSSGTTGLPKGVVLSHRNLISAAAVTAEEMKFGPEDVLSNVLPTFHISGQLMLLVALYAGGTTFAEIEFNAESFIKSVSENAITHSVLVPAMILFVLQTTDVENGNFQSLKMMTYGGAPITGSVLDRAMEVFQCEFLQVYGLTEVSGAVSMLGSEDHQLRSGESRNTLLRSAGRPAPGADIRIVDPKTLENTVDGITGEIWVNSDRNFLQYWGKPDATAAAYHCINSPKFGWMRTGDIGLMQDGYLFIKDRLKDMIISGGENIYPAEVENVLSHHNDIKDCAIIGVPDEVWGESVKACVVLKDDAQSTELELINWMRERLAHYKCPKSVDFLDDLPRNAAGKILKRVLREPFWSNQDRQIQ